MIIWNPTRLPADLLQSIRTYPLFAVAAVVLAAMIGFAVWTIARDFVSPRKYVTVEFYDVDMQLTANNVTVSIERVAFRPGYKVRLGSSLTREGGPELMIDGFVTNGAAEHLAAFLRQGKGGAEAVFESRGDKVLRSPVHAIGARPCPFGLTAATIVEPGGRKRFSIFVPAGGGAPGEEVRRSVSEGLFPRLSLGEFALGNCTNTTPGQTLSERWRVDFGAQALSDPELLDYYPYGAPTSFEIGINGRRYWSDWLPHP